MDKTKDRVKKRVKKIKLWSSIVISVIGSPYLKQHNVKEDDIDIKFIDEVGRGFVWVPNNQFSSIRVNPMFCKCAKQYILVDCLFRKYSSDTDFRIFAPDEYWNYQRNISVIQILGREQKQINHLHGNIIIKCPTHYIKKMCGKYADILKEEDEC